MKIVNCTSNQHQTCSPPTSPSSEQSKSKKSKTKKEKKAKKEKEKHEKKSKKKAREEPESMSRNRDEYEETNGLVTQEGEEEKAAMEASEQSQPLARLLAEDSAIKMVSLCSWGWDYFQY